MASVSQNGPQQEKVQVLRTRTFPVPSLRSARAIADIVHALQWDEKFTGKLSVNFSQGGVASVTAEEKLPNQF